MRNKAHCQPYWERAATHGLTYGTVQSTLTTGLGLVKKSGRWVHKFLLKVQKQEPMDCSSGNFLNLITQQHSRAILDNFVTMDQSAVSFHIAEIKQSKQWVNKGQPGPSKGLSTCHKSQADGPRIF